MPRAIPRISEAEWQVMREIWRRDTATAQEVVQSLEHTGWNPRTVKTLLNRLVKKGALTFEEQGRAYLYRAAVRMQDCIKKESETFLDRVFGGAPAPLLMHFARNARLTRDELDELRRILKEKAK
jgi:BlaI family penicillinase repressor